MPGRSAELVLLLEDPDAPGGTFTHWVLFGVSPKTSGLARGRVPKGAKQGRTSFGQSRYGGPCPPEGDKPHRYRFTLYALSRRLALRNGAAAKDVRSAARRSAIASARLVGTYGR